MNSVYVFIMVQHFRSLFAPNTVSNGESLKSHSFPLFLQFLQCVFNAIKELDNVEIKIHLNISNLNLSLFWCIHITKLNSTRHSLSLECLYTHIQNLLQSSVHQRSSLNPTGTLYMLLVYLKEQKIWCSRNH